MDTHTKTYLGRPCKQTLRVSYRRWARLQ